MLSGRSWLTPKGQTDIYTSKGARHVEIIFGQPQNYGSAKALGFAGFLSTTKHITRAWEATLTLLQLLNSSRIEQANPSVMQRTALDSRYTFDCEGEIDVKKGTHYTLDNLAGLPIRTANSLPDPLRESLLFTHPGDGITWQLLQTHRTQE